MSIVDSFRFWVRRTVGNQCVRRWRSDGDGGVDSKACLLQSWSLAPEGQHAKADILRLLVENGGVLEQSQIADDSAWSRSTVSRHIRELEQAEHLDRRDNGCSFYVFLPGAVS